MTPSWLFMSTPKYFPLSLIACLCLNLLRTSTESNPALSAMVLGITSNALAKALTISCYLPWIFYLACYLRNLDNSSSIAPPPATTVEYFMALLTIIIASFNDLSASEMNYSAPPLKIIVAL